MHDVMRVSVFKRPTYLRADFDDSTKIIRRCRAEVAALDEFHHEEGHALVFADIVHGDDVWMIQRSGGASFTYESLACVG